MAAARLDLEAIVAAGLAIASRPGTQSVTVRELGAALGADPTAIYRHVRSKDGLVQVLLDRVLGLAVERVTTQPEQWREHLRDLTEQTLVAFIEHPAIGAEAVRLSSHGASELRMVDSVLAAFAHAGLDEQQRVRFYGIWSVYVVSFCAGIARDRMASQAPEPQPWLDRSIESAPGEFPAIDETRALLAEVTDIGSFRAGLELILEAASPPAG